MPSMLAPELVTAELGGSEPWPEDCKLFQPFEVEQILLPESANCKSVQAFLKMCNLRFDIEMRANAEQMSPTGQVPFIKCGAFVVAEMEPIVSFVNAKGLNNLSRPLDGAERGDMTAYMMLVNTVLYNAELFICWCHEQTLQEVTYPRYAYAYPWPLNYILCWKKRRAVLKKLSSVGWNTKTLDEVLNEVESCCQALSERLENRDYFFGDKPTELDALVFGHLSAILTTPLPIDKLGSIVRENEKLVQLCSRIAKIYFDGCVLKDVPKLVAVRMANCCQLCDTRREWITAALSLQETTRMTNITVREIPKSVVTRILCEVTLSLI